MQAAGQMRPPPPRSRAALAVLVSAAVLLLAAAAAQAPVYHDHWEADDDDAEYGYGYGYGGVACTGTVGDCAAPRARRELGGGGTIAYGALQKDRAPCSYRGASYYNCGPSGAANPYSRGCSAITQCRG
ncbi:hypothetical protein BS78_03G393400 [Paspalum vaginatum]|nr:hypothetical protein BS78_03G393400 [Paspalum vaginatum]